MPFRVESPYQPTGDQPRAIEQLAQGLAEGYREQTLLGATATGKSLGYADPVYLVEEHDGGSVARVEPIGPYIDALMAAAPAQLEQVGATTILDLRAVRVRCYAQAFDPLSGVVALYPVRHMTRHRPDAEIYRLTTACGRQATLTGDHNLWVLRDGSLQLIRTGEARPGDAIPLPELLLAPATSPAAPGELPGAWPDLPLAELAAWLRSCFADAKVQLDAGTLGLSLPDVQQASLLSYALLRFGIWARLACAEGWQLTIGGQADLRCFHAQIGLADQAQQAALASLLDRADLPDQDVVPGVGPALRILRDDLVARLSSPAPWLAQPGSPPPLRVTPAPLRRGSWGGGSTMAGVASNDPLDLANGPFAAAAGLAPAELAQIEADLAAPRRTSLVRLLEVLAAHAEAASPAWWAAWRRLRSLTGLRWTPVASLQPITYAHSYVYDLSIPGPETFLAGQGGMFVHNTFVMAKIFEQAQRPTLVLAHNKTLVSQLWAEFRDLLPDAAVEMFISYYDEYTPEAYVPSKDLYIEKEASINEEIDRLRHAATQALFTRRDVLIVASVSAIYGLGSPHDYGQVMVAVRRGEVRNRDKLLRQLIDLQFERNDVDFHRGTFRVRGDTLDIVPANAETAVRIAFWGDEIERISEFDPLTGELLLERTSVEIYPAKHFVTTKEKMALAVQGIQDELQVRLTALDAEGKALEAARLKQRTTYDLEMLSELGYCSGIENYSRHMDGRTVGQTPWTLLDYFPDDLLIFVDESHITLPQVRGMFLGDRQRKQTLVDYGFRLPSALDNRPLQFEEFDRHIHQAIYVSATPSPLERSRSKQIVEQIIRPTGLIDPLVEVRSTRNQVDDLISEVRGRVARQQRALVTTLTKRMAEDLADYLKEVGIRTMYLHADIDTLERVEILRDLRLGVYDVVVGINLLREGLDLPEVSLVCILDADKEGFLRSETSLIQTIGRAARHLDGTVIMYADTVTASMAVAIKETQRRRDIQMAHNLRHGITPVGISKGVRDLTDRIRKMAEERGEYSMRPGGTPVPVLPELPREEVHKLIKDLEKQMKQAARDLQFEQAAGLRDQIVELRKTLALE